MYLLDTNIISHWMREPRGAVVQHILGLQKTSPLTPICTSVIVDCELQFGMKKQPSARLRHAYDETMRHVKVHGFEAQSGQLYASLRFTLAQQGTPLDANDLLIASHALSLKAILVSADHAFTRVPGLIVENWIV